MDLKLERPVVFFDLETTGVSFSEDRIVDVALLKRFPPGQEEIFESLVNPGISIPAEATAIHHITNEIVRDAPPFSVLAPKLLDLFNDSDVGGFGISRFDLPMLAAEFKRNNFLWSMEGRRVVDAMKIFHRMEPRTLSAASKFYCGKSLEGAHRASADAKASAEVFWAQMERYPDLPKDMAGLHGFCASTDLKFVDPEGKFVWGKDNRACFNFGKYRMVPLDSVARKDPSYLMWLAGERKSSPEVIEICTNALRGRYPVKRDGQ
ncbi:MAG: 3'-5' exonuclease [Elusimicrobia bacterium]|nr:3'-5' exonuclease [Elusimicrobiota bacterium]